MEEQTPPAALVSALTTEYFVLQTAANSTVAEAGTRSTLYVMALSSALVAIGFLSSSRNLFLPFSATVLPAVFVLGLFTVSRLVDTSLEYRQCLCGIARIRGFFRRLGPEAAEQFAAKHGRWPEVKPPAAQLGPVFAFLSTAASMVAVINNTVAGAAAGLFANAWLGARSVWVAVTVGALVTSALTALFVRFQYWRFSTFEHADPDQPTP
jgi:hypothetical protein